MTASIEKVEVVYKGWSTISKVALRYGDHAFTREVEDHGQAVGVLPYDPVRRMALLVQMPRTPVMLAGQSENLLEAPAGLIDPGEDPEHCARREAEEEAGVALHSLERLANAWSCPGVSTERIVLFLAEYQGSDRVGEGGGLDQENEHIAVVELPLADLAARTDRGDLTDLKTFALVQTLRLRRPELFSAAPPAQASTADTLGQVKG
jgi:nudix-type nucleoside diphosphatase (YffH/AdpP family)